MINPLGENRNSVENQEFDITPDIQAYSTNKKLTTKNLDKNEEESVFDILRNVGFYDIIPKIGFKGATMRDIM